MTKPQTMLQLSGRSYNPATLTNATLLVIDVQEEYRSGVLALPALDRALPEITRLLAAARAAGAPAPLNFCTEIRASRRQRSARAPQPSFSTV